MSVRIKPCHGCPIRSGCPDLDTIRSRVRGIGAVSVTFKCKRLDKALAPGTRIKIMHPLSDEDRDEYGGLSIAKVPLPATITTSRNGRFACTVDEHDYIEDRVHRFRRMGPASRVVEFLDERRLPICEYCGSVRLPAGCDTSQGIVSDHQERR